MACLTSAQRTALLAQKTKLEDQLALANTAYDEAIVAGPIESYRFDPGGATQQAKRRSPEEIQKMIDSIQARLDRVNSRLAGTGLMNMSLRR